MKSNIVRLIVSIFIPLAVGAVAGIATVHNINGWYEVLNKPVFNPPNNVFGPMWTILYLLMGISLYLIWQSRPGRMKRKALYIFFIQLTLNFAWSFVFFQFHLIFTALIEIVVIWCSIILMISIFYSVNKTAAWLQLPYLLWVSFATVLNASIWYLN